MRQSKNILAIIGSANNQSSNKKLVEHIIDMAQDDFKINIFGDIKQLPHFDPALTAENTPKEVIQLWKSIEEADGILISSPEYVFSIPSGLKNVLEWCVSTTLFSGKPTGIITAAAHGQKAHEELQLIMKTLMANFNEHTCLLIEGIKGKLDESGQLTNEITKNELVKFISAFTHLINGH